MAAYSPDFAGFERALAKRTIGLGADARKQAAAALFASLYLHHQDSEELGGIVLWDELANNPSGFAR